MKKSAIAVRLKNPELINSVTSSLHQVGVDVAPSGQPLIDLSQFAYTSPRGRRNKTVPDLNVSKLARACKVQRSYMCLVVNGKHVPGRVLLERLAEVLGVGWEEADKWLSGLRAVKKKRGRKGVSSS